MKDDFKSSPQASPGVSPRSPRAGAQSPRENKQESQAPRRKYVFSKQGPKHALYQVACAMRLRRARVYKKTYAGGRLNVMPRDEMLDRIRDNWKKLDKCDVFAGSWGAPLPVNNQRQRQSQMTYADGDDEESASGQ